MRYLSNKTSHPKTVCIRNKCYFSNAGCGSEAHSWDMPSLTVLFNVIMSLTNAARPFRSCAGALPAAELDKSCRLRCKSDTHQHNQCA
eukprot:1227058-Amphidinium_carterae.1